MAEKLNGVKIEGFDIVKNMVVQRSQVKTCVASMIKHANIVETKCAKDFCEVEMELKVVGNKWYPRISRLQIISIALFGGEYYFTYSFESKNIVAYKDKIVISKNDDYNGKTEPLFYRYKRAKLKMREFVEKHKEDIVLLLLQNRAFTKTDTKTTSLSAQKAHR